MADFIINISPLTEGQFDTRTFHIARESCNNITEDFQIVFISTMESLYSILEDYYYTVPYKSLYITPLDDASSYNNAYLEYNGTKILPINSPTIIDVETLEVDDIIPNLLFKLDNIDLNGNLVLSFNIEIEDTDNILSPSKTFYIFVEDLGCAGDVDVITEISSVVDDCSTEKVVEVNVPEGEERRVIITSTQGANIDEVINTNTQYPLILNGLRDINDNFNTVTDTLTMSVREPSTNINLDGEFLSRKHTGNLCE